MAAVIEQNMALEADTPGDVRHRADVRITENVGRQLWVDVKVMSSKPKVGIKNTRSARQKSQNANSMDKGLLSAGGNPWQTCPHGANLPPWRKP